MKAPIPKLYFPHIQDEAMRQAFLNRRQNYVTDFDAPDIPWLIDLMDRHSEWFGFTDRDFRQMRKAAERHIGSVHISRKAGFDFDIRAAMARSLEVAS